MHNNIPATVSALRIVSKDGDVQIPNAKYTSTNFPPAKSKFKSTEMRSLHQRGRQTEISLSQFFLSLLEGAKQLLPGDFAGLLMCRPGSSHLGTSDAKRCRRGFLEVYKVLGLYLKHVYVEEQSQGSNRRTMRSFTKFS